MNGTAENRTKDKDAKRKPGVPVIALLNGLLLLCLTFLVQWYGILTNTLENNGRWESTKAELDLGVMGAQAFMVTQRGLAGGRLDLGTWHGNQEVFVKEHIHYQTLSFDYELEDSAHFICYFNEGPRGFQAIRLSADPRFPSAWLTIQEGVFTAKNIFQYQDGFTGNHRVTLHAGGEGPVLSLDGQPMEQLAQPIQAFNLLGFRGSSRSAWVDMIQLKDARGKTIWSESFRRKLPIAWIAVFFLAVVLGLNGLILTGWVGRALFPMLLVALAFSAALWAYYAFHQQYQYPRNAWMVRYGDRLPTTQRTGKTTVYNADYRPDHQVLRSFGQEKQPGQVRVLFIGASQTWGAGASAPDRTWVSRLEDRWNAPGEREYVCMNAAVSGQESASLLPFQRYLTEHLGPDVSIINLSFNDRQLETDHFRDNLLEMVKVNQMSGVQTILVPEVSNEDTWDAASRARVASNRTIVAEVGAAMNVPVVPVQDSLWAWHDRGFLFWDEVHLTDFGQQKLAEIVGVKTAPLLSPAADSPLP